MLASTNNSEAWRSPDGWSNAVAGDLEKKATEPTQKPPPVVEATKVESLNFAELQDEVARMATTSPQEILERLRHLWSTNPTPAKDMKVYTETHRWMLSAIHHLDSPLRVSDPQDTLVVCENHGKSALMKWRPNVNNRWQILWLTSLHFVPTNGSTTYPMILCHAEHPRLSTLYQCHFSRQPCFQDIRKSSTRPTL